MILFIVGRLLKETHMDTREEQKELEKSLEIINNLWRSL